MHLTSRIMFYYNKFCNIKAKLRYISNYYTIQQAFAEFDGV